MNSSDKHYELQHCPNCGSVEYEYGHTLSRILVRSLTGIGWIKLIAYEVFQVFIDPVRLYVRVVMQGTKDTPLLICKQCKDYVVVCPKCDAYSVSKDRPWLSDYIKCNNCDYMFCTCERSDLFDQLLGKNRIHNL